MDQETKWVPVGIGTCCHCGKSTFIMSEIKIDKDGNVEVLRSLCQHCLDK